MTQQKLNRAQVLGPSVDERCLRASYGMGAVVCRVKPELDNPVVENPGVLTRAQVRGAVDATRKQEVLGLQTGKLDLLHKSLAGADGDFELHGALRLVLHHDGTSGDLVAVTDIAHLQ